MAHILVVEDEATIREFIRLMLVAEGYAVMTADDGEAALTLVAQNNFALILLDLNLPKINGNTFLDLYDKQPITHAPIIILTATHGRYLPLTHPRVTGYLEKPFNLSDLLALANQFAKNEP